MLTLLVVDLLSANVVKKPAMTIDLVGGGGSYLLEFLTPASSNSDIYSPRFFYSVT